MTNFLRDFSHSGPCLPLFCCKWATVSALFSATLPCTASNSVFLPLPPKGGPVHSQQLCRPALVALALLQTPENQLPLADAGGLLLLIFTLPGSGAQPAVSLRWQLLVLHVPGIENLFHVRRGDPSAPAEDHECAPSRFPAPGYFPGKG